MAISVFDLFKIGIGPSSSHTVGPMIAARKFILSIEESKQLKKVNRIKSEMYGSLGATGKAHGTPKAVILGLEGEEPDRIDATSIPKRIDKIYSVGKINLLGKKKIDYDHETDLKLYRRKSLPFHPNGMTFTAYDEKGSELMQKLIIRLEAVLLLMIRMKKGITSQKMKPRSLIPMTKLPSYWNIARRNQLVFPMLC